MGKKKSRNRKFQTKKKKQNRHCSYENEHFDSKLDWSVYDNYKLR